MGAVSSITVHLLLVLLFALVVATLKTRVIEFGKKDEKELH